MVDVVDPIKRSSMMAGIRGRDTKPEMILRRALHALGFRYRLHARKLPGKPDLVFPKFGAVVFVNGCFWHRHEGCHFASNPATRPDFWKRKFDENVARDRRNVLALTESGWRVAIVWECALRRDAQTLAAEVGRWLTSDAGPRWCIAAE